MENMPVYDYEDAINFIAERSDIRKSIIEKVLMLEEDYMRSIGIVIDEKEEYFEVLDGRQRVECCNNGK